MTPRLRLFLVVLSVAVAALAMWLWLENFHVTMADFRLLYERLHWWPLPFLFVLLAGHVALASWRWSIIEQGLGGQKPGFAHAFAAGSLALGLGTLLPGPVVNIACRSLANRVNGMSSLRGALSGTVDQLTDLAVIALLAVPAAVALKYRDLGFFLGGALTASLLGLAIVILLPKLVHAQYFPIRLQKVASLFERSLLFKIYCISLLRAANLIVMTLAIYAAIGTASISAIVIGVPLIALAISVAMLPGAIGVSEWSFSAVFSAFGIPKADIVIFVLANRVVLTGLSLLLMLIVLIAIARKLLVRPSAT
jgi:hypothetical protein